MVDFVTLACPTCGGKLEITEDVERFACGYCGYEHLVQRRGGIVTLRAVSEELAQIRSGTDRTASELAIQRLQKEIRELEQETARQCVKIESKYKPSLNYHYREKRRQEVGFLKSMFPTSKPAPSITSLSPDEVREMIEDLMNDSPLWPEIQAVQADLIDDLARARRLKQSVMEKRAELQKHKEIVSAT